MPSLVSDLLTLAEGEVHVWFARPPMLAIERLVPWLSDDEQRRARAFHFERHRREHIATRALVRTTLSRYRPVAPPDWVWKLGEFGKPAIAPPSGLYFNASNHPSFVVCGVSAFEELGVDVEPLARGEEILRVASDVFSPPELRALYSLEDKRRLERAVSLWTAKEAYVKARGIGLSAPLREIVVEFDEERPKLRFLSEIDTEAGWTLEHVDVHDFRIAIAVRGAQTPLRIVVEEAAVPFAPERPPPPPPARETTTE